MPAIRRYRVTQTQEVRVTAANPAAAVAKANRIFEGTDEASPFDIVRTTDIMAMED